jgi:uncharacterized protein with WD repeat
MSKSAKKNAARRAKKAAHAEDNWDAPAHSAAAGGAGAETRSSQKEDEAGSAPVDENDAKEKKARALKKKIRQCEQLREKRSAGADLTPEQEVKLNSIEDLCAPAMPQHARHPYYVSL